MGEGIEKLVNVDQGLHELGASELAGAFDAWGGSAKLSPYTAEDIKRFATLDLHAYETELSKYNDFVSLYKVLAQPDKDAWCDWVKKSFVDREWVRDTGIRPRWTWENFLRSRNDADIKRNLLDIGSCHGLHSIFIYKERDKGNFKFHSCDLLPAYLKLHTLGGIDARMWDAKRTDLRHTFAGVQMDVILCTEVIEHLRDEEEEHLLQAFSTLASPGAQIMITYPQDAEVEKTNFDLDPLGHRRQPEIEQVVSRLGPMFDIVAKPLMWSGRRNQQVIVAVRKP